MDTILSGDSIRELILSALLESKRPAWNLLDPSRRAKVGRRSDPQMQGLTIVWRHRLATGSSPGHDYFFSLH